jgi:hypothetical protein
MATLTAATRNQIPTRAFALPGRRYPIADAAHARNALSRVSQFGSPAEKSRVRGAVHRRYPAIGLSAALGATRGR